MNNDGDATPLSEALQPRPAGALFDFIRRAMPYTQPRSLTDQEMYALTAYLLAANKLIGENDEVKRRFCRR
jgi:hypothetical protein